LDGDVYVTQIWSKELGKKLQKLQDREEGREENNGKWLKKWRRGD
jgi:hypothetical protein